MAIVQLSDEDRQDLEDVVAEYFGNNVLTISTQAEMMGDHLRFRFASGSNTYEAKLYDREPPELEYKELAPQQQDADDADLTNDEWDAIVNSVSSAEVVAQAMRGIADAAD